MLWSNYSDASLTIQESQIELLSVLQMQYTVHHTGIHAALMIISNDTCAGLVYVGDESVEVVANMLTGDAYYCSRLSDYVRAHAIWCPSLPERSGVITTTACGHKINIQLCELACCAPLWSRNLPDMPFGELTLGENTYLIMYGVVVHIHN